MDFLDQIGNLLGLGVGASGGGYAFFQSKANKEMIKEVHRDVESIEMNVNSLSVLLARDYITREETSARFDKIHEKLDQILYVVANKVDI